MRSLLTVLIAVVVLLVVVLVVMRRGRGAGQDLIAAQLSARGAVPAAVTWTDVDPVLRAEVEQLVTANRRLAAIARLREATGSTLGEAKAVVDHLGAGRAPVAPARRVPATAPSPRPPAADRGQRQRSFPPGFDIDPRRPARDDR